MGIHEDKKGRRRVILLHRRREILEGIKKLPMLLLDATMPEAIVRRFLPNLNVLAEVKAQAPHMTIHQILGGWGKTSLVQHDKASKEENSRRGNMVAELADFVRINSGGDALAVTYKAIENNFKAPGVATGHFNNMAGIDAHKNVRSIFVIGRPFPDATAIRAQAMALTGRPIAPENGQVETRGALMADGTGYPINVRVYADSDMEALRTAITDREVIQVIGRGRAVWRQEATPLDVFVFADVVLPLPVTRVARWEDVRLDIVGRMLARGAAILSPTDAAKTYPDLFPGEPKVAFKAAEYALSQSEARFLPNPPKRITLIGDLGRNQLQELSYRPQGRGQSKRTAYALRGQLDAVRGQLEAKLGQLAAYEVVHPAAEEGPQICRPSEQPALTNSANLAEPQSTGEFSLGREPPFDVTPRTVRLPIPGDVVWMGDGPPPKLRWAGKGAFDLSKVVWVPPDTARQVQGAAPW